MIMTEPIIGFSIFLFFAFALKWIEAKHTKEQLLGFQQISYQLLHKKEGVKCSNTTNGLKNGSFMFSYTDLYFYENAFIIVGYNRIFKKKLYHHIIILTNEKENYQKLFPHATITLPKKFNPNSFGGDVYIEFGKFGFTSTNVTIRLKGLSEEEKELIFM